MSRTLLPTLIAALLCGAACSRASVPAAPDESPRAPPAAPAAPSALPLDGPLEVEITGSDYEWHLRYPGRDGVLGTADDVHALRHLHVPAGISTRLRLHSTDFLYTFTLPGFALKEIAVPDLEFELVIPPSKPGESELVGDQFCGLSHPTLIGRVVVQEPDDFAAWLTAQEAQ